MNAIERDARRWKALMKYCGISSAESRDGEAEFEVSVPCHWEITDLTDAIDEVIKEQE